MAAPTLPSGMATPRSSPPPENTITKDSVAQLELLLFENADAAQTIFLTETIFADPNIQFRGTYTRPRLYYLLALAYELSGDEESAVKNYRHILQHYSNTPYSILSQAKLEGVP